MKKLIAPIFLLALLTLLSSKSFAQPGTLDANFGTAGKVTTVISANDYGLIVGLAMQTDGKIVGAGNSYNNVTNKFFIKTPRYNADGTLDNSFGNAGLATNAIGTGVDDQATAVVIQPDGKILICGYTYMNNGYDFFILRLKSNGISDSSFGTNGVVVKNLNDDEFANSMVLQSDGKIVIGGSAGNGVNQDFMMARYKANGVIDSTFGNAGISIVPIAVGSEDVGSAIAIQTDGRIILGGSSFNTVSFTTSIALIRIKTNGVIDSTFGTLGKVVESFNFGGDYINALAIQPDGNILAAGESDRSTTDMLLVRFTSAGVLDNTFGSGGIVYSSFGLKDDRANALALQLDGKILLAGSTDSTSADFAVLRFTNTGILDTTFGTKGLVATNFGGKPDVAKAITVQANGKIILAGRSQDDFALARYNSDSIAIDAGIMSLTVPPNKCGSMGTNQTVMASVKNNGTTPIAIGALSVNLSITGANSGSYNLTNSSIINANATANSSFNTVNLSNIGNNVFTATLTMNGDIDNSNNSMLAYDSAFNAKPIVNFSSTNANNTYSFTSTVTGRGTITYLWNFGDGSATSTVPNPTHHYPYVASYNVKLIATDDCGIDSTTKIITITTGLNANYSNSAFTVFPNPANSEINLKYIFNSRFSEITIHNLLGEKVQIIQANEGGNSTINTSELPNGIYFIEINNSIKKICVNHLK